MKAGGLLRVPLFNLIGARGVNSALEVRRICLLPTLREQRDAIMPPTASDLYYW
jgi:hypothetical protein